jgi:hypothetical protein
MMASMPNPPSKANPSSRGIAWDIDPRTPPRLQVVFPKDQRQYPICPKLARPQIVQGFTIQMGRNYYKQAMALSNARKEEVYKYENVKGKALSHHAQGKGPYCSLQICGLGVF